MISIWKAFLPISIHLNCSTTQGWIIIPISWRLPEADTWQENPEVLSAGSLSEA